uniref:Uncharacterized protein n=1 Tax=Rhizochromulina marina TaxID=1034831 RepID=A0A7S2WKI8_9STRA
MSRLETIHSFDEDGFDDIADNGAEAPDGLEPGMVGFTGGAQVHTTQRKKRGHRRIQSDPGAVLRLPSFDTDIDFGDSLLDWDIMDEQDIASSMSFLVSTNGASGQPLSPIESPREPNTEEDEEIVERPTAVAKSNGFSPASSTPASSSSSSMPPPPPQPMQPGLPGEYTFNPGSSVPRGGGARRGRGRGGRASTGRGKNPKNRRHRRARSDPPPAGGLVLSKQQHTAAAAAAAAAATRVSAAAAAAAVGAGRLSGVPILQIPPPPFVGLLDASMPLSAASSAPEVHFPPSASPLDVQRLDAFASLQLHTNPAAAAMVAAAAAAVSSAMSSTASSPSSRGTTSSSSVESRAAAIAKGRALKVPPSVEANILGQRPRTAMGGTGGQSPYARSPPNKQARHRKKGHRRARSEPIDMLLDAMINDEIHLPKSPNTMLPSPSPSTPGGIRDLFPSPPAMSALHAVSGSFPLFDSGDEPPPSLSSLRSISGSVRQNTSFDTLEPPQVSAISSLSMGSASFDVDQAEAFNKMQAHLNAAAAGGGLDMPFATPPIEPPFVQTLRSLGIGVNGAPVKTNTKATAGVVRPRGHQRKHSTGSSAMGEDEQRGKYRCGRCGQFKVNHVCPFIVDTACRHISVQADPMALVTGERTLTVQRKAEWGSAVNEESPATDVQQYTKEYTLEPRARSPEVLDEDEDGEEVTAAPAHGPMQPDTPAAATSEGATGVRVC